MSVSDETPYVKCSASGADTYAFGYKVFDESDLVVKVSGLQQTLGLDFTVNILAEPLEGGNIVFQAGRIPAVGTGDVEIERSVPLDRTTDYQEAGGFRQSVVDRDFDRLVMQIQERENRISQLGLELSEMTDTIAQIAAGSGSSLLETYTLVFKPADLITKGPWVDARAFGASESASGAVNRAAIQAAIESISSSGGGSVLLTGFYTIDTSITLYRSVSLVGTAVGRGLYANGNFPAIKFASNNGSQPFNCRVADMTIQGSNNPAHTSNNAIELANGVEYSIFSNLKLHQMGGNSIQTLGNPDNGAIYNVFINVQITNGNNRAVYLNGNIAQNTFINMRIYGLANLAAGVVFEDPPGSTSTPLNNTFIGGGVESGGPSGWPAAGFKAVWFKDQTSYAAYNTKFLNFYIEPGGPTGTAAGTAQNQVVSGYYIESAKGVHISGIISFCHYGVWVTGQYAEGVNIDNVEFTKSNAWGGDTSGNAMIRVDDTHVVVHVGPGCTTSVSGTYAWPLLSEVSTGLSVYGFRNFDDKKLGLSATSDIRRGRTLQSFATLETGGSTAITEYTANAALADTLRRKVGGGADVVDEQYLATNVVMNGTDTGGQQGMIKLVHSLNFTARPSGNVNNGYLFVDSTDNKLKYKDASGNVSNICALTGTSGSIGGGSLAAGAVATGTVAVAGCTTGMAVAVSPVTYPGDGAVWSAYVSSAGTVTVVVTATKAMTPVASAYNVRVLQ
jgi:hypothetical protein